MSSSTIPPAATTMSSPLDRLSALPDEVLVIIISLLPLDLAIRTSLLRKRWRLLWTCIPRLDLDENYFTQNRTRRDFLEANKAWLARAIKSTGQARLVDFARLFLASYPHHDIDSLRICMSDSLFTYYSDVIDWLRFAVDRKVRNVDLSFFDGKRLEKLPHYGVEVFELPRFFYKNKHIQTLKLTAAAFRPRSFTRFVNLRELSVSWIRVTQNLLDVLFANCKALDALTLEKCTCIEPTKFSARNNCLSSLAFEDCWVVDNALIVSLPLLRTLKFYGSMTFLILDQLFSLDEVELDFSLEEEFQPVAHHLCQMLMNLEPIKALTLCTYTLQGYWPDEIKVLPPTYLPLHLLKQPQNLEYLTLKTALQRNELPGVVFLVRSYPKLNTITFILQPTVLLSACTYPFKPVTEREDFWKVDNNQPVLCFQLHLRVVKIENFRGSRNEIDLLKFFLREANSLRKVILCLALDGVPDMTIFDEYVAVARQVESFERKSNFLDFIIE